MEQSLPSHTSDQLEEKDITLVLEQLQENGFSSFFDHPDCPFSSIQEVDEALKELEKEFLKICMEQEAKSSEVKKKSRISVTTSSASSNSHKFKPKTKKNDFKKENKYRFGTREKLDKRDSVIKKTESPKFGLPSTSRSASFCHHLTDRDKKINPAECGDSKDVCGIDSCGNKYSLKIEVFATVKLEPEERNEAGKNVKPGSKIFLSRSKLKRNENLSAFNPLVIPTKDQTDSCSPLVLNYRSSVCKPCPSYMYPTACDLRKNFFPQKRKVDALARSMQIENDKIELQTVNTVDPVLNDSNKVSEKTSENVSVKELGGNEGTENQLVLRNGRQKEVKLEGENPGNYNFEKSVVANYTVLKQAEEYDPDLAYHSMEVQTSVQDGTSVDSEMHFDNHIINMDALEYLEPPKMFNQEQQTSFDNIASFSSENEDVKAETTIPEQTPPKFEMIDKEVETSLFLLFDQNLINELKGLEEMIAGNIINEDNYEEIILNDADNEEMNHFSNLNHSLDKNIYELIINSDVTDEYNVEHKTSEHKIGTEKTDSFPLNGGQHENSEVRIHEINGIEAEEASYIDSSDVIKYYDKEFSESSSNETVIMVNGDSKNNKAIPNRVMEKSLDHSVVADEPHCIIGEPNTVVIMSEAVFNQVPTDLTLPQSNKFELIDKAVGTSCEGLSGVCKADLIDKEVDSMSKEYVNLKEQIEIKSIKSIKDSASRDLKKIHLIDKETGMSNETFLDFVKTQKTKNKEMRATSVDSIFVLKTAMVDKEVGPEIELEQVQEKNMIDKEIETAIESKSMSTNMDELLMKVSVKEMGTGVSKHLDVVRSKTDEPLSDKESSNDSKFAKWSKSKVPMGQKLFKKPGSKSLESDKSKSTSDKYMKIIKERREKKKSEEGSVKSRELATKKDDKDNTPCSTSSTDHLTRHDRETYRWKEISEYETKFVKGVFSRHSYSSAAKNKIALRRRAFSNLDQKVIASKLAKSRKMIGSLKSAKKSSWERSKSHSGVKLLRKQPSKELSTSSGEYRLPENTVINVGE